MLVIIKSKARWSITIAEDIELWPMGELYLSHYGTVRGAPGGMRAAKQHVLECLAAAPQSQTSNYLRETVYPHPSLPVAVLTVEAVYGDWIEAAFVRWPVEFLGPAAIAGACCNPRYGIA